MREFQANGRTISAYLAVPEQGSGPGVLVLHAWWGLTDIFKQACDRLAEAGFVALAPDLYHGKTTASVEEAQALSDALDSNMQQWRGDIAAAVQILRQQTRTQQATAIRFFFFLYVLYLVRLAYCWTFARSRRRGGSPLAGSNSA